MATTERAFAGNVEVASGCMATKVRAGDVGVANNGFTAKGRAGDVEVAKVCIAKEMTGGDVKGSNGFTAKKKARNVEVANGFTVTKQEKPGDVANNGFATKKEKAGEVEIATNGSTAKQERSTDVVVTTKPEEKAAEVEIASTGCTVTEEEERAAEVLHDFSPLLVVYKSGRLERPLIMPLVPPGHDAATGVVSRDVPLSGSTFARLYLPSGARESDSKLPVVVYFHGGGFVIGSAASCVYHRFLNDLAAACPAVAVSVDYRLAPEHLLPAAYEDALAALRWVVAASDPWLAARADPGRVFLAGDSAGGNICHHLAMHPDVPNPIIKGVVLIHPWFWGKDPIDGERAHRRGASSARKMSLWEYVCPDAAGGVDDPRMNPTGPGAPGLGGLACERVMVCVAEGDHLRWRGKAYAAAAARAGKEAETVESEGVGHVFYLLDPDMDEAREMLARIAAFVNYSSDSDKHEQEATSECAAADVKSLTIE